MSYTAKWDIGRWDQSYWDRTYGTFGRRRPSVPEPKLPINILLLFKNFLQKKNRQA